MTRPFRLAAALSLLATVVPTSAAHAQAYPPGYGGYGWGGWGVASPYSGSKAAGMGVFAAGAGQYNVDTAQARQMNTQTAEQFNDYMWNSRQQHDQELSQRLAAEGRQDKSVYNAIQDRILNNPTDADVASGDALNAILTLITAPRVYPRTLQAASQQVPGPLVRNIPFVYAAGGLTYSLAQLTSPESVPAVFSNPAFAEQRKELRAMAAELRKETLEGQMPKPETLKKFRTGLDRARATLDRITEPGSDVRLGGEKYLKALYGLSRMLESPAYDVYLAGVEKLPSVPLADVLSFMHAFNLRFGPAKTPEQRENNVRLYGMLSQLRQGGGPPPQDGAPPQGAPRGPAAGQGPDPRVTNFFSGMEYNHFNRPGGPPPQPPAPGASR